MSKIFRPSQTVATNSNPREITIRNLHNPLSEIEEEPLTKEVLFVERDRLLKEARQTIEIEQNEWFEQKRIVQQEIDTLKEAWEHEKNALQQQAYEEAFQLGFEEGRNKALSDMHAAVEIANEVTMTSKENAQKYLASQERVILELAIRSASRILGRVLEEDHESFLSIVKKGLKEARESKEIKLFVSLEDFELVSSNRTELMAIFPPDIPFFIFADEDLQRNDCMIETNQGRIVASVKDQLSELKEKLVELLESGD
ncbi:flagellar assembly protein FliH [Sporosarcina saromensis]|uniref:Flagellar assembly protein FliH n=1 Tax=Sporosarcina saromensis TaxID=359365 RepID=A0ABU4G5W4_9BACL|nr:flagellar assembly protein FliH [Sporosarcina saromensis]MDW0111782.1 flagellar assembly protein FliH [Sporosarcina saromensis]